MHQLKIAVCDDYREDRNVTSETLASVFESAQISAYAGGRELLETIEGGGSFDLIFLDIFLKEEDGLLVGRQIRKLLPKTQLVFVSNSREFGPEAYDMDALHYLVKPIGTEQLLEVQKRFFRRWERSVVVRLNHPQQDIPLHLITYIESAHNDLVIHLLSGSTVTVRESLSKMIERLDERFLRINRGVIINMEAVEWMKSDSCQIAGMVFMLGRKHRMENRKRYHDWLFEMTMREEG